jgi:phage repressor protein C with HTH and peptisase S24 domain
MFTHKQIWAALDAIAEARGTSVSALALRAGFDATAFNRSKRIGRDGRLQWPSTETLAKTLTAADMNLRALADLIDQLPGHEEQGEGQSVPKGKRKNKRSKVRNYSARKIVPMSLRSLLCKAWFEVCLVNCI